MLLVFFTTPPTSLVRLTLDVGGLVVYGAGPQHWQGRDDAHLLDLPTDTPLQGALVHVESDGYTPFEGRGIVVPEDDLADFTFDDVHLSPLVVPSLPDHPTPPTPDDPLSVITWVYEGGTGVVFDLTTKEGCGQFTEACALALFRDNEHTWGHVVKNPGQNQWNGHAVDAIHALYGDWAGIWDIIRSSESPEATPVFNLAGPSDPDIWAPPFLPPPYTATRRIR